MKYLAMFLIGILLASLIFWMAERNRADAISEIDEIGRLYAPIDALIDAAETPEDCKTAAFQAMIITLPYLPSLEIKFSNRVSGYESTKFPPDMEHFSKELLKGGLIFGLCIGRLQTEGKISAEEAIDYLKSETVDVSTGSP